MTSVLLVGDLPDIPAVRAALALVGCELELGNQQVAPLEQIETTQPHLIILGVGPSCEDVGHHCRAIRSSPSHSSRPILALVPRSDDTAAREAFEAGAEDVAARDLTPELLAIRVERLIRSMRLSAVARLNEQLLQVGRLLTGVVHEIRGPLSVIRGSAEFLRLQLADQPDLQVSVDPILRNAEVLKTRLEHLMATVRSRAPRLSEVNVRAILTEAAELFAKGSALRGCPVRVVTQLDDESLLMRADPGQLMLVVLSLLNNAHDAFIEAERTGGSIEIRARQCEADGMSWVTITVQDDGPGVPEPALARIFEPFFTTKEHGTGYGLYLALETMKEQRGRITVESPPGAGACFTIWIPGSSQAAGLT